MYYKNDWEKAKKRYKAFWNREIVDRCLISIKAVDYPKITNATKIPTLPEDRLKYWTDTEEIIKLNRFIMENTYYAADSFPYIFLNLGAAGHAGFFKNANYRFEDSVWFFPSLTDIESLEFDENSFLYQKTIELAKACAEDSKGDYIVSMPDSTGNADALAHLLGSEELLPMMIEEPELVKQALNKIEYSYEKVMQDVYNIVKDVNDGGSSIGWMSTWAPGFHAQMQCDMSVMISNPMFKEFIMPELTKQCKFLDYATYHFDGIEQIRHLDDLLSIPELKAIQWTQVDGQPPCTNYFDVLQKIQAAGKNLIMVISPNQIHDVMEKLSSKGLFIRTEVATREEADYFIKEVERLTHE